MNKQEIATSRAPSALGPYSQAIAAGGLLFISGQLAIDPATGSLVEGTIGEQTSRIMDNIKVIAEAAGTSLESVVKTTIFLTDLNDFQEVNQAYGSFFEATPPARATVQVAALPLGACVEIEAIAVIA